MICILCIAAQHDILYFVLCITRHHSAIQHSAAQHNAMHGLACRVSTTRWRRRGSCSSQATAAYRQQPSYGSLQTAAKLRQSTDSSQATAVYRQQPSYSSLQTAAKLRQSTDSSQATAAASRAASPPRAGGDEEAAAAKLRQPTDSSQAAAAASRAASPPRAGSLLAAVATLRKPQPMAVASHIGCSFPDGCSFPEEATADQATAEEATAASLQPPWAPRVTGVLRVAPLHPPPSSVLKAPRQSAHDADEDARRHVIRGLREGLTRALRGRGRP
jgi:hypothetical protein